MNSPFSICTRFASVLSVPVRLNNRNDRTTGIMERDIKRYKPIHLLCFAKVFFNLQTPTGRYGKCYPALFHCFKSNIGDRRQER